MDDTCKRDVIEIGIYYAIYNAAYQGIYSNIQIYLGDVGVPSTSSGYIYIALSLLPVIAVKILHGKLNELTSFISNIIFILTLALLMLMRSMMLILLLLFVWRFMYGFFAPNTSTIIDKKIGDSGFRSTILAFINVVESLVTCAILAAEGYIADKYGGRYMLIVSAGIVILLTLFLVMNRRRNVGLETDI